MAVSTVERLRALTTRHGDEVPGLPLRAIAISNHQRTLVGCARKYLIEAIDGLRPAPGNYAGRAPSYGTLYHRVKESVYRAWMEDRPPTDDEMRAGYAEAATMLAASVARGELLPEVADDIGRTLVRNIEVWRRVTGGRPLDDYRLVAFEKSLAMPILDDSGRPYQPEVYVVPTGRDGIRMARSGEAVARRDEVEIVRWPWYFLGRLDMVFVHRRDGHLMVADDKSTESPTALASALSRDPQAPSYILLADHAARHGYLGAAVARDAQAIWFAHRIYSSKPYATPQLVLDGRPKKGEQQRYRLSVAANQRVPSWEFEAAIRANGLDPARYAAFVERLRVNVDERVEQVEWSGFGPADLRRTMREIRADAHRIAALWRAAARLTTVEEADETHPRYPLCSFRRCGVARVCASPGDPTAYVGFEVRDRVTWTVSQPGLFEPDAPRSAVPAAPSVPGADAFWDDGATGAEGATVEATTDGGEYDPLSF